VASAKASYSMGSKYQGSLCVHDDAVDRSEAILAEGSAIPSLSIQAIERRGALDRDVNANAASSSGQAIERRGASSSLQGDSDAVSQLPPPLSIIPNKCWRSAIGEAYSCTDSEARLAKRNA